MPTYTRKNRREEPVEKVKPADELPYCWEEFLKEGERAYDYMIHNYEKMVDIDAFKNHFTMYDGIWQIGSIEVLENHGDEIQKVLLPWIKKEYESGQLFQKENWKPFRDPDLINWSNFGYKKMFQYKQYYLQLSIGAECENYKKCIYCTKTNNALHFQLLYYGWKDDTTMMIQPDNRVSIPNDDMIMPERLWNLM